MTTSTNDNVLFILGDIRGTLNALVTDFAAHKAEVIKANEELDRRVTFLEKALWIAIGVAAASGGGAGFLASAIFG